MPETLPGRFYIESARHHQGCGEVTRRAWKFTSRPAPSTVEMPAASQSLCSIFAKAFRRTIFEQHPIIQIIKFMVEYRGAVSQALTGDSMPLHLPAQRIPF